MQQKGYLSCQMVYKRVRGWTSWRSLPVFNFVKAPPPGGGAKPAVILRNSKVCIVSKLNITVNRPTAVLFRTEVIFNYKNVLTVHHLVLS